MKYFILLILLISEYSYSTTTRYYNALPINNEVTHHCDLKKLYEIDAQSSLMMGKDISLLNMGECEEVNVIDGSMHSVNGELLTTPFKAQTMYEGFNGRVLSLIIRSKKTGETMDELSESQGFINNFFTSPIITQLFIIDNYLVIVQADNILFLNKTTGQFCNKKLIAYSNHRVIFVKYMNNYYYLDSQGAPFSDSDITYNLKKMPEYLPFYRLRKIDFHILCGI